MKKFKSLKLLLIALVTMVVMAGCDMPFGGGSDKDDKDDDKATIEVSTKKVTVDAGDEEIIEIENYDDLKKLTAEVDDEDIATVEETDDGEFTVYGISEGKTEVTFSAKGCDDVTVKITVDAGEAADPVYFDLSEYYITVGEGDDYYIYVFNYDDLENVDFEVDDLDVAGVYESSDGEFIISGYEEGSAVVTFHADGAEDCEVYVDVEAANDLYTINDDGYVEFGTYEQDGKSSNGAEPIEWEVVYEDKNGMLLMSRYVLDLVPFEETDKDTSWEDSYLREWLNDDFYYTAFTSDEQTLIDLYYCENNDNDWYGVDAGNDTYDYVFVLSLDEILDYYDYTTWYDDEGFGYFQDLMTEGTNVVYDNDPHSIYIDQDEYDGYDYTNSEGEDTTWEGYYSWGYDESIIGLEPVSWWLRNPGKDEQHFGFVWADGETGYIDWAYVSCDYLGVRPCIYIAK